MLVKRVLKQLSYTKYCYEDPFDHHRFQAF